MNETIYYECNEENYKFILNELHNKDKEIQRLKSIIEEVREYINYYAIEDEDFSKIYNQEEQELLEILDKVEEK